MPGRYDGIAVIEATNATSESFDVTLTVQSNNTLWYGFVAFVALIAGLVVKTLSDLEKLAGSNQGTRRSLVEWLKWYWAEHPLRVTLGFILGVLIAIAVYVGTYVVDETFGDSSVDAWQLFFSLLAAQIAGTTFTDVFALSKLPK